MKKLMISTVIIMAIGMSGCGKAATDPAPAATDNKPVQAQEVKKVEDKKQLMDIKEIGEGTIILDTASGTSEDNNIPFMFYDKENFIVQIGYSGSIAGDKLTYVYVDGILNCKEQNSDNFASAINLSDNMLDAGLHVVEFIQYDNNKEDGQVEVYRMAKYEFKKD